MAENADHRKLTAILCADVKGYSKLMGENESYTVGALKECRNLFAENIQNRGGRVVNAPGDSILAEFPSVVSAVQCAVEIQNQLNGRNADLPDERKMAFRIGVNLGDVIQSEDAIYGDGVNIAARIEALAEPGGVAISGNTFDNIGSKLDYGYQFIGEHIVKNIVKPVRVYKVLTAKEHSGKVIGEKRFVGRLSRKSALAAILILSITSAGLISYYLYLHQSGRIEPVSTEKMVYPLPDKPSIAVLPFKNLSGEPKQEYLADGITESIIGTISRVTGLFVIASNSVFTYKGKAVKVQTVSKEQGTVQKAGNQLRVNAQLIDAITGQHLWSKKYDQHMKDIFSVQDHISKEILTALRVKFLEGEQELVWARGTDDLEAYLRYLEAYDTFKSFNKQNMILTRQICEEAIALDPTCEPAYSLKGMSYLIDLWFGWAESYRSAIENCEKALKISISLNPQSDFAYANLGHLYLMQRRHDEALVAGKKSVDLNPNGDYNMVLLAMTLMYSGRSQEAIPLYKDAWRRNPYCPAWYIHAAGVAYRNLGEWEEAIAACKKALVRKPDHFPALDVMASVYGMSGQLEEGRAVAAEIMKINPGFCVEKQTLPYINEADAEAVFNSFRKVGIPGCPKE